MDGTALVLCEGAFGSTDGKTAHGLVRFTRRYAVRAVVDSTLAPSDAGEVLDGRRRGIPIVASLAEGLALPGPPVTHVVVGVATSGGRLPPEFLPLLAEALDRGLNVDSGLHEFVGDNPDLAERARRSGARIRDIRRPAPPSERRFFTGRIAGVRAPRIAVLGTDCAAGKRTTSWLLVEALAKAGRRAVMVGTGQTAFMQGVTHGCILDATVNDFVTGAIEHAVVSAFEAERPDILVIEGQGSLIHPASPGGFEILAAAAPAGVVLQHVPGRRDFEGFPGWPIAHPSRHIEAIRILSGTPTFAITLSREGLDPATFDAAAARLAEETGLPVLDPLGDGAQSLADVVLSRLGAAP